MYIYIYMYIYIHRSAAAEQLAQSCLFLRRWTIHEQLLRFSSPGRLKDRDIE